MKVDDRLEQLGFESDLMGKKFSKFLQGGGTVLGLIIIEYAITLMFGWKSPVFDGIALILIALWLFQGVALSKEYNKEVGEFKAKLKD